MAEDGSWPGIRKHGLLSTSALLDLFDVTGSERSSIESERRLESVTLKHPVYGKAVVRDQKPLREGPLAKCLIGLTLQEWYETLNSRVFFWLTEERLKGLLMAIPYRSLKARRETHEANYAHPYQHRLNALQPATTRAGDLRADLAIPI
jgi:hypothetical protein